MSGRLGLGSGSGSGLQSKHSSGFPFVLVRAADGPGRGLRLLGLEP